jgi:hypothetical protein
LTWIQTFIFVLAFIQQSGKIKTCIKTRPDGLTNLPPGKVDAKADAAPAGATNREMRRPSLEIPEGFFYV